MYKIYAGSLVISILVIVVGLYLVNDSFDPGKFKFFWSFLVNFTFLLFYSNDFLGNELPTHHS